MSLSLRRIAVPFAVGAAALFAAGCDGENLPSIGGTTVPGGAVATGAPVVTDLPAVTDAPVVTEAPPSTDALPATGVPATSLPGDADDDSGVPGWLIPVGAALAVLAVVALWLAGRRRGDRDPDTSRQRQAIALAGWIHDHLTLEVLASPPADAVRRWEQERNRVDQLTIEAGAFATVEDSEMWDRLVQVLRELSTSIDVALRLRGTPGADQDLVRESIMIANRHRAELASWLTTATATI
jgi:hypothetical protein